MSIALMLVSAAPAWSAASGQQQGAALLAQIQNGQTSCSKLSASNLELMGEYDMGRIMGSTAAYNAMNAQMQTITGASGEQLAYRFMGELLGGCATGNGPVGCRFPSGSRRPSCICGEEEVNRQARAKPAFAITGH
jgi:hypothetical protein